MIRYPWEKDPKSLPDNIYQAVKQLELMELRLAKKPGQATAYDNQMNEMETLRFVRKRTTRILFTTPRSGTARKIEYSNSYRS